MHPFSKPLQENTFQENNWMPHGIQPVCQTQHIFHYQMKDSQDWDDCQHQLCLLLQSSHQDLLERVLENVRDPNLFFQLSWQWDH